MECNQLSLIYSSRLFDKVVSLVLVREAAALEIICLKERVGESPRRAVDSTFRAEKMLLKKTLTKLLFTCSLVFNWGNGYNLSSWQSNNCIEIDTSVGRTEKPHHSKSSHHPTWNSISTSVCFWSTGRGFWWRVCTHPAFKFSCAVVVVIRIANQQDAPKRCDHDCFIYLFHPKRKQNKIGQCVGFCNFSGNILSSAIKWQFGANAMQLLRPKRGTWCFRD